MKVLRLLWHGMKTVFGFDVKVIKLMLLFPEQKTVSSFLMKRLKNSLTKGVETFLYTF